MLSSLCVCVCVSLPSQVTRDLETFSKHSVGLVIFCELHENHHNRATLPPLWRRIGLDEFQLAMAPGWIVHDFRTHRVWPDVPKDHKTKGWRLYFQAGLFCLSGLPHSPSWGAAAQAAAADSRRQQEAAGGSRRQHHQ